MTKMDVLVMPYQQMVSIGPVNSDTSKWMSPLKMFEYMASKVTIISSDLPVLREVLSDSVNCLMVKCDDVNAWCRALKSLQSDALLRKKLSDQAFADVINKYTWDMRASKISKLWKK